MFHKAVPLGDVHKVHNWQVATLAARNALTLTVQDIGKIVWQQDTDKFYFLKNNVGPVWIEVNATGFAGKHNDLTDYAYDAAASAGLTFTIKNSGPTLRGPFLSAAATLSIAIPDNSTRRVYVNTATMGLVLTTSDVVPKNYLPIATVTTAGGVITAVVDRRPTWTVQNSQYLADVVDGSDANSLLTQLFYDYYGIKFLSNAGIVTVVDGAVALAASATNYVFANMQTGAVSVNTVGFPAGSYPMATIVTGATTITSITDSRAFVSVPSSGLVPKVIPLAVSDETTALAVGVGKVTFRAPYAMTLSAIRGSLTTAQATGALFAFTVKKNGVSLFSTNPTIDNTEKTTVTAVTPSVLSSTAIADDDEITIDITVVGDGTAKGLKVSLIGT